MVAHVPHSSVCIPADVRDEILVSDSELAGELVRLTDWFTDDLFGGLADHGVTMFVNRLSRFVFDPERFLDDSDEPMAPRGQGVVYWLGSQRQPLRVADTALRSRRVEELYRPYHAALDAVVDGVLDEFGSCTLLDCHSFPSVPLPSEMDQATDRPDICIGTDEVHTPPDLAEAMVRAFGAEGLRVKRDSPFGGTFVPSGFYGRDARVNSVMVEVRRGLYIDESSAERRSDFDEVSATLKHAVMAGLAVLPAYSAMGPGQHSS